MKQGKVSPMEPRPCSWRETDGATESRKNRCRTYKPGIMRGKKGLNTYQKKMMENTVENRKFLLSASYTISKPRPIQRLYVKSLFKNSTRYL
ncbi:MAG: hypothetical protein ABEJ87_04190 [Candidatus Nanohalobium sp.]